MKKREESEIWYSFSFPANCKKKKKIVLANLSRTQINQTTAAKNGHRVRQVSGTLRNFLATGS